MNEIEFSRFLEKEVYPSIYRNAESLFPEFSFKKISKGYQSTTGVKVTGEEGKKGKVYYYENTKFWLHDYTRGGLKGGLTIWNYVKNKYGLNSNKETYKKLCNLAGVEPLGIDSKIKLENLLHSPEYYRRAFLFSIINGIGKELLYAENGQPALNYLINERGYKLENIKKTEWIFLPQNEETKKRLIEKLPEASAELLEYIKSKLPFIPGGLSFAYRDRNQNITGFKNRVIAPAKDQSKYGATRDTSKNDLLNIYRYNKEEKLLIVEGAPEALYFHTLGIPTAAIDGSNLLQKQIDGLKIRNIKEVILSLDNDKAGIKETPQALELLLANNIKTFVIPPESLGEKKDLDEILKAEGEEALKAFIKKEALSSSNYQLLLLFDQLREEQKQTGEISDITQNEFLKNVAKIAKGQKSNLDKSLFLSRFENLEFSHQLGVKKEHLEELIEEIVKEEAENKREEALSQLIKDAESLQKRGKGKEALKKIKNGIKEISSTGEDFSKLLEPITEAELLTEMATEPEALYSGYTFEDNDGELDDLEIEPKALTVIAGATTHGKSLFLINLLLNVIERYKNKRFYLFSYEEDKNNYLVNTLNVFSNTDYDRNNRKALKKYFTKKKPLSTPSLNQLLKENSTRFFKLIEEKRLNINYVDYGTDTLIDAIHFLSKQPNTGGIFIDYLQLHNKEDQKNKPRQEELKTICQDLKNVSIDTGLPIILAAQFNRECKSHDSVLPTNVSEAGDIERIANLLIGIWNNNFRPNKGAESLAAAGKFRPNTIYTKILKRRGGAPGLWDCLRYNSNTGKITSNNPLAEAPEVPAELNELFYKQVIK